MRVTYLLRASHYTPRIQFMGQKWKEAKTPHAPHPHPMAPTEISQNFKQFLAKSQSSSANDTNNGGSKVDRATESGAVKEDVWKGKPAPPVDYENFWEAPEYIWKQKEWTEREIEAVMSGGATEIRSGP